MSFYDKIAKNPIFATLRIIHPHNLILKFNNQSITHENLFFPGGN